jgi:cytochrome P450
MYYLVPVDVKAAAQDDVLPGGQKLCKGTRISFDPYAMGRLEKLWGPDCEVFNPDRWLKLSTLPSPYEFPVFQAGPRICLGESLAKFEASLLLGVLLDRFEFTKPTPDTKFTYAPGITLTVKGGLPLRVKKL